jgi:hypothetical protein
MKKYLTIIGCALVAQVIPTFANAPDWRDAARSIERDTGCTPIEASDAAREWAKRNGYQY